MHVTKNCIGDFQKLHGKVAGFLKDLRCEDAGLRLIAVETYYANEKNDNFVVYDSRSEIFKKSLIDKAVTVDAGGLIELFRLDREAVLTEKFCAESAPGRAQRFFFVRI